MPPRLPALVRACMYSALPRLGRGGRCELALWACLHYSKYNLDIDGPSFDERWCSSANLLDPPPSTPGGFFYALQRELVLWGVDLGVFQTALDVIETILDVFFHLLAVPFEVGDQRLSSFLGHG